MSDRRRDSPLNDDWQAKFDAASVGAAREQLARDRHRRNGPLVRLAAKLAVIIAVVAGGAAVATHPFWGDDGTRGAGRKPPLAARPVPPALRVAAVRAVDPVERVPPWGMRVYPAPRGRTCLLAGRIIDGRLGRLRDGRFAQLGETAQGACGDVAENHFLAVTRCEAVTVGGRTALYGVVDRQVIRLELATASGRFRPLQPALDGTFLVVRRGTFGFRDNRLRIIKRGGATKTLHLQPVRVC